MKDPPKIAKYKQIDFALFAALWWPRASWSRLVTLTYFTIWIFVWDDEIDTATNHLSMDFDAAEAFREQTIAFVRHNLGIATGIPPEAPNPIINSFGPIAEAVRQAYDQGESNRRLGSVFENKG